jgi:MoaA/NifB/PqqE/SkfB family radical SAM enzyme
MAEYEAWLHWNVGSPCDFSCSYCFAVLSGEARRIRRRPAPRLDAPALLGGLRRSGRAFRLHFSGHFGEPFLVPGFVDACSAVSREHFITLNTHLASPSVGDFARRLDPARVPAITASLHPMELERRGLEEVFAGNFRLCRERGFNIRAVAVAFPGIISEARKWKAHYAGLGVPFDFLPFIGGYHGKGYPGAYTRRERGVFGMPEAEARKYRRRGRLCNAGFNAGVVHPDGTVSPCAMLADRLGSVYEGIRFKDSLTRCPFESCPCPMSEFDLGLFDDALRRADGND